MPEPKFSEVELRIGERSQLRALPIPAPRGGAGEEVSSPVRGAPCSTRDPALRAGDAGRRAREESGPDPRSDPETGPRLVAAQWGRMGHGSSRTEELQEGRPRGGVGVGRGRQVPASGSAPAASTYLIPGNRSPEAAVSRRRCCASVSRKRAGPASLRYTWSFCAGRERDWQQSQRPWPSTTPTHDPLEIPRTGGGPELPSDSQG